MIGRISGILSSKKPTAIIVDVNGVGYRLQVSLTTFYSLPEENEKVSLDVYTHVREEAIHLFGFSSNAEKEIFEKLIRVSKVGPKLALTILSGLDYERLTEAVRSADIAKLSSIPGVGKKTAERLILELADKLPAIIADESAIGRESVSSNSSGSVKDDATDALIGLGYKKNEAIRAVEKAFSKLPDAALESLLREALASLAQVQ